MVRVRVGDRVKMRGRVRVKVRGRVSDRVRLPPTPNLTLTLTLPQC